MTARPAVEAVWDAGELRLVEPVCAAIDAVRVPRSTADGKAVVLRLSEAERLRSGNAGGSQIVFTRHLCAALGFDEHRLLDWRLEHKLVQALVVNRYRPGAMAVTRGLARLRGPAPRVELRSAIAAAFAGGFYAKTALGDSSGGDYGARRSEDVVDAAASQEPRAVTSLTAEESIVQELVPVEREYRVHSFEDRVVPALSFLRYGGEIVGERDAPNAFVQSVLDALPAALVSGTMLAWDVARTAAGRFAVIEMNVAGTHRFYNPGFQCSGFFHLPGWARLCVPRLLLHLEGERRMRFEIVADRPAWPEHDFYVDVAERYASLRDSAMAEQARRTSSQR